MTHEIVRSRQQGNAIAMRRVMTEAELRLWNERRAHRLMGLGFRRQVPIGPYIADFACAAHRIIVEVDGSQHGGEAVAERDEVRSAYLAARGWAVLRFWNDDILRDIDNVCLHIVTAAGLSQAEAAGQAIPNIPSEQEEARP
jgi:very-short-patch-repair endonuclease